MALIGSEFTLDRSVDLKLTCWFLRGGGGTDLIPGGPRFGWLVIIIMTSGFGRMRRSVLEASFMSICINKTKKAPNQSFPWFGAFRVIGRGRSTRKSSSRERLFPFPLSLSLSLLFQGRTNT